MVIPKLATVILFPSVGPALVTRMIDPRSREENITLVRKLRYASDAVALGSIATMVSTECFEVLPEERISGATLGMNPRNGISRYCLTSSGVLILLSKYSKENAKAVPITARTIMAREIF